MPSGLECLPVCRKLNERRSHILENHYGENVWVHRKGAVHAAEGEVAIIPGSMGSNSYIVKGLGNRESFLTSSHGAGRSYSRTGALEKFSVESVMLDLKERNVVLGKNSKKDVAFVPLYMGKDGKYHYDEKNYRMWHRYEPDTNCPLFHSKKRKKGTKWLLQLNPYGVGDNGKGGVATGYIYVPRK